MSMFSFPDEMMPTNGNLDEMKRAIAAMPTEMASAVNLMAHPLAGAAAMSALGMGVASQAFGLWLGSVSNAVALSQRMMAPMLDGMPLDADAFRDASRTPEMRAGAALDELAAGVAADLAEPVASPEPELPAAPASEPAQWAAAPAEETAPAAEAPADAAEAPVAMRQPLAMTRPETPDDFKAIAGIGPKLEQVLNGFGLWTYGQIAALSAEEIGWLEDAVGFKGRIGRDGWVAQAAVLAAAREGG
ncbi:MAG: NADH-ubiquinone dehydrogenase [Rhizobiaceae bacterium]|nr:NADH-ubiquinone dehydrogenase [Rhizobiaceae bacterium]